MTSRCRSTISFQLRPSTLDIMVQIGNSVQLMRPSTLDIKVQMTNSFQLRPSTHDRTSWCRYQQPKLTEVQQHMMMMRALAHRTSAKLVVTLVGRISNQYQITSTPKVHTCRLMFVTRPVRQVRKQLGFVRPICSPSCRGPIFCPAEGNPL